MKIMKAIIVLLLSFFVLNCSDFQSNENDTNQIKSKRVITGEVNSNEEELQATALNSQSIENDPNQVEGKEVIMNEINSKEEEFLRDMSNSPIQRIDSLVSIKKFAEAIKEIETQIEVSPTYAEGYFLKGILNDELGQFDEAQKDYNKSIEIFSKRLEDSPEMKYELSNRISIAVLKKFTNDSTYLEDFEGLKFYEGYEDMVFGFDTITKQEFASQTLEKEFTPIEELRRIFMIVDL